MSVHYKFKSALDFDTITFDGLHISVADLKKAIIQQKRIGKIADFDLQITNAQTKEEYTDDATLIPKNTSLTIARIPLAVQPKKQWEPSMDKSSATRMPVETERAHVDLSRINGSEEDKINAMMMQSTADYDPTNYQKIRGSNQTGEVPMNYRCFKCHKPGHWIKNCPLIGSSEMTEVKRNTGIPRSFIEQQQNELIQQPVIQPPVEKKQEIPEDLICSICKDLFTDAVMIPCCGSSFCDECVRTALLESEDNECPDCHEKGSSPGSLIPNRFLRNSVNSFKNETGYNRKPVSKPKVAVVVPPEPEKEPEKIEEKEESDYEDNITVTVPPAHLQCRGGLREGQINGRGRDESPRSRHLTALVDEERSETPTVDENDIYAGLTEEMPHRRRSMDKHMHGDEMKRRSPDQHYGYRDMMPTGAYGRHRGDYMPPHQQPQPLFPTQPRPLFDQGPYGGNHRVPYHNRMPPGGYPSRGMRPGPPIHTLASVYQGVAAKVGPGIIDDPLEAFNRIMREKERRKERRRSRSPEMDHRRPPRRRISRGRSPDMRRQRSPERRSEDRRRKRSSSYSRSSRSSRTPRKISRSPRKRSRTPRNRTRSRSPSFSISRSRSRSISPAGRYRDRGPQHNRNNRSPPHSRSPPRHRPREHRRGDRRDRDDFPRESYRDKSPPGGYNRGNRGYARNSRGRGPNYNQRDRPPLLPHPSSQPQQPLDPYYQSSGAVPSMGYYPDDNYQRYPSRGPPGQPPPYITNLTPIEPHRFDEGPREKENFPEMAKEVDQPPVPGLEGAERFEKYPKESYTFSEATLGSVADEAKSPKDPLPDSSTCEERRIEEKRNEEKSGQKTRSRSKEVRRNRERSRTRTPNKWDIRRATSKEKNRERESTKTHSSRRGGEEKKRVESSSRVKERGEEKKYRESSEDDAKKRSKEKKKRKKEREMEKEKKRNKKEKRREKEAKSEKSRGSRVEADLRVESSVVEEAAEKVVEKAQSAEEESTTPNHRILKEDEVNEQKLDMSCDLYGDIMDKNDINMEFGQADEKTGDLVAEKSEKNSPAFMRNDSILDINPTIDFDQDMEDTEASVKSQEEKKSTPTSVLVTIPEPSKWELDEEAGESHTKSIPSDARNSSSPEHKGGNKMVTNEVLKRAENALFSRAINAIRPIEIRSINAERRKLYEDDADVVAPVSSVIVKTSPAKELHTFQITVPTNSDGVERSVEIKSGVDGKEKLKNKTSPVRSIKDRLGVKIVDDKESPVAFTPTLESEIRRSSQKQTGKKESAQSPTEKRSRHNSPRRVDDRSRRGQWSQRETKRAPSRERRDRGVRSRQAERPARDNRNVKPSGGSESRERRQEERKTERGRRRSQEKVSRDRKRSPTPRSRRRSPSKKRSRSPRQSQNRERTRDKRRSPEVKKNPPKEEVKKPPIVDEDVKKLVCDESTFEPDYENPQPGEQEMEMEAKMRAAGEEKEPKELPVADGKESFSPEPLRGEKKASASVSNSSSSDSDSSDGDKRKKRASKHRKQKRKRSSSTESTDKLNASKKMKKSKKKSSKSHKKKKKSKHK
ncbi:E3 ubiquitin-protein ligase RBBP6 isoform X2 [Phlebotomus argentipes]|uniref:E3 ubiquitin-protein ligase RBBP6 isoform X2 n=1 Tax=Phlebotomus argentipes TaxID=94469 RepID=UPI002892D980|nr:E3 ubiquitin-protein ligase RBBP6 isoform X2 [Phlebotomus argentipes]